MNSAKGYAGSSVWTSAKQTAQVQRTGRYLQASRQHPGKMLPAIAAQAIATYTSPGDLAIDPMCGIGTNLVEAIHQGRQASASNTKRRSRSCPETTSPSPKSLG